MLPITPLLPLPLPYPLAPPLIRRERNRVAARKCRAKKLNSMEAAHAAMSEWAPVSHAPSFCFDAHAPCSLSHSLTLSLSHTCAVEERKRAAELSASLAAVRAQVAEAVAEADVLKVGHTLGRVRVLT